MKTERNQAAATPLLKPAFNKAGNQNNRQNKLSGIEAEDQRHFDADLENLLTEISTITSCAPESQAQTDERIRTMMMRLKPQVTKPDLKNNFALQAQRVANRGNAVAEVRVKSRKPRCGSDAKKKHEHEKTTKAEWQRFATRRPPNGFHPSGRHAPNILPGMTSAEISAYMAAYEAAKASQAQRLPAFADGSWLSPKPY